MDFVRYEEVPGHISQKVVAEAKAEAEEGRSGLIAQVAPWGAASSV